MDQCSLLTRQDLRKRIRVQELEFQTLEEKEGGKTSEEQIRTFVLSAPLPILNVYK